MKLFISVVCVVVVTLAGLYYLGSETTTPLNTRFTQESYDAAEKCNNRTIADADLVCIYPVLKFSTNDIMTGNLNAKTTALINKVCNETSGNRIVIPVLPDYTEFSVFAFKCQNNL